MRWSRFAQELVQRLKEGLVTVLDVRPEDEYAAGHLPKAVNIPCANWRGVSGTFRRTGDCCLLPWSLLRAGFRGGALLRRHGFKVRRLQDGFPEWSAAGLSSNRADLIHR